MILAVNTCLLNSDTSGNTRKEHLKEALMRRTVLSILLLTIAASWQGIAQPQSKKFGIGLIIGAPTGLSIKYWSTHREAIQAYVGGGFGGIAIGADYVFHSNEFDNPSFPFYYGPGAFVGPATYGGPRYPSGTLGFGVRFMFGVDYLFPNNPFDIAFEIGPALVVSPNVGLGLEGGLAFRFYP